MYNVINLKDFLDSKVREYNCESFINDDPISIPHQFSKKEDIEIAGFFASMFAWGRRSVIIQKAKAFLAFMDNCPYDFIVNHGKKDLLPFKDFKHRTFNGEDACRFIGFLKYCYSQYPTLEEAFLQNTPNMAACINTGPILVNFYNLFTKYNNNLNNRSFRHISSPARKSACKKLNMFLRWMVRKDDNGVDFGIWEKINPSQLVLPCDVHVINTSISLGFLNTTKVNWDTALYLTGILSRFDANDPIKYDFALFGIGVSAK